MLLTMHSGDPSGWPTPSWSSTRSKLLMKRLGVKTAILSVTAPGACILHGQDSFDLARKMNEYAADLRNKEPQTFGFFASLPSLLDTEATLTEIAYALDTLHADGVVIFTRYGDSDTYLGHPSLESVWAELNRRQCVVFVHPTHPVRTNPVNPKLPQPAIDYPHETTRAAMDMILMGTREKYPNCKVILSHAGGALPYLITRVATPMRKTPDFMVNHRMGTTHEKVMEAFRSFHFDLALSASPSVLRMALEMIPHDHILYGVSTQLFHSCCFWWVANMRQSDFPYAPITAYPAFLEDLEGFAMSHELRNKINFENAHRLFPRLANAKDAKC